MNKQVKEMHWQFMTETFQTSAMHGAVLQNKHQTLQNWEKNLQDDSEEKNFQDTELPNSLSRTE